MQDNNGRMRTVLIALAGVLAGTVIGIALMLLFRFREIEPPPESSQTQTESTTEETTLSDTTTTVSDTTTTVTTTTEMTTTTETTTTLPPPPEPESLRAVMHPAEEQLRLRYYYTDSDIYETHSEAFGWTVPFTTEKIVLTYDGVLTLGIQPDKIGYTVRAAEKVITVSLPAPELLSHELDLQSIRYFDVKSSIFRSSTLSDYAEMVLKAKDSIGTKIRTRNNLDEKVLNSVQALIRACLGSSKAAQGYAIEFAALETEPQVNSGTAAE